MSCGHMDGVMAEKGPPTLGSVELDPPVVLIPENARCIQIQVSKQIDLLCCVFSMYLDSIACVYIKTSLINICQLLYYL